LNKKSNENEKILTIPFLTTDGTNHLKNTASKQLWLKKENFLLAQNIKITFTIKYFGTNFI